MELSRRADIDNSLINHITKIQSVNDVDDRTKLVDEEQYKKVLGTAKVATNEVILDNVRFGYNEETQDFFIKVVRAGAEYKYPTEDMMKVKAYLLDSLEQKTK